MDFNPIETGWTLKSGEEVFARPRYDFEEGIEARLSEILPTIDSLGRQEFWHTHDFEHVVGKDIVVEAPVENRRIFYWKRPEKRFYSRMSYEKEPADTSFLTIILKKIDKQAGKYIILNAHYGAKRPPEPWDKRAVLEAADGSESPAFWKTHAYYAGAFEMKDDEFETDKYHRTCPWPQRPAS